MNAKKISVTKIFDENSPGWRRGWDWNMLLIKYNLIYAYEVLRSKGYLFLNELYQQLGFPLTKQGQIAGWVYNDDDMCIAELDVDYESIDDMNRFAITFRPFENILDVLPDE